ncbi:hypothetical protein H8356DRAFT_1710982 [Neocallimastix lanati (nom. inval.)]|nr:hypothetical protein H8356DRAFT_1710982 [Neocallimastix sp. JGI-2020a]
MVLYQSYLYINVYIYGYSLGFRPFNYIYSNSLEFTLFKFKCTGTLWYYALCLLYDNLFGITSFKNQYCIYKLFFYKIC